MNRVCDFLMQDWAANPHDLRIRMVLVLFRGAQWCALRKAPMLWMLIPYLFFYRVLVFWVFHMELNPCLTVGKRLCIFHGYCLVIHPQTIIGNNVTLRHCVTLGNKVSGGNAPVIGDNVEIGANAVVLGPIIIGNGAVIGAGAIVTKNVASCAVVAGNPAKVIRMKSEV